MSKRFFTCFVCHQTFEIDEEWTEEDALEEFKQTHPDMPFEEEKVARVCDECFEKYVEKK